MSDLDFSRCRLPSFNHQREDVAWMMERLYAFIASEMRTGKTKIVIDAAQFLFEQNKIDRVIVVAPAPVRDVWYDRRLGELAKHLWIGFPSLITEYHAHVRTWIHEARQNTKHLEWYVTNYEYIGASPNVQPLLEISNSRTLLVLDESSYIKNHSASRTKACAKLRAKCGRVVLMNGTPIYHSPLDLFSQGNMLHPSILECPYITKFKARYAIQDIVRGAGGKPLTSKWGPIRNIVGWSTEGLEDLQRRFAPHTVRRLQKDCLDLPPKLDPVTLTAPLTATTWRAYQSMLKNMVIWFEQNVSTSETAAIKVLRLSQITSGFVGGVEDARIGEDPLEDGFLESLDLSFERVEELGSTCCINPNQRTTAPQSVQEIGREKLDVLLWFLSTLLEQDENLKVVVWHRFRAELERTIREVQAKFPQFTVASIYGGQKRPERQAALALLKPETAPAGPVFVAGTAGTGSFGLDFSAAHTCITMSSGYSPGQAAQMLDRVYGPGQKHPIAYYDIVAIGPKGQRTIDHVILETRRAGEDVATWTSGAWVKALTEE